MDPDQTGRMRKLVWIHAGRKLTMLIHSVLVDETYNRGKIILT
jgi:hypothetical protein